MTDRFPQSMNINGTSTRIVGHPMDRLLDVLRENLHLSGTKEGCGEGECGACSVLMDGELVNSCLVPFGQCRGKNIDTIETKNLEPWLSTLQQSFLECGGAQCGICTPGMVMAGVNLLRRNSDPNFDEVKEAIAGNLCRCTGYTKIIASILDAAAKLKAKK